MLLSCSLALCQNHVIYLLHIIITLPYISAPVETMQYAKYVIYKTYEHTTCVCLFHFPRTNIRLPHTALKWTEPGKKKGPTTRHPAEELWKEKRTRRRMLYLILNRQIQIIVTSMINSYIHDMFDVLMGITNNGI